jgi:hypothetical protein
MPLEKLIIFYKKAGWLEHLTRIRKAYTAISGSSNFEGDHMYSHGYL